MEKIVDIICERRNKTMGISNGVLLIKNRLDITIFETHKKRITIDRPYSVHSLLNSNSSNVLGKRIRGVKKKIA